MSLGADDDDERRRAQSRASLTTTGSRKQKSTFVARKTVTRCELLTANASFEYVRTTSSGMGAEKKQTQSESSANVLRYASMSHRRGSSAKAGPTATGSGGLIEP